MYYVIESTSHFDTDGIPLYYKEINEDVADGRVVPGWVDLMDSDHYSEEQKFAKKLPRGGRWVKVK